MKKLTVGMRTDELPGDQLPGSWRHAKNSVINKKDFSISNEDGADDVTPTVGGAGTAAYPSTKKVIGVIQSSNEKILFLATTVAGDAEIGRIKSDGKYYPILKDSASKLVLNFNENFPIHGPAEKRYNNNTVISWTDNENVPYILNIDCLPFTLDGDFTVTASDLTKAQSLIRLFPTYKYPSFPLGGGLSVLDGQGVLTAGVYYPVFAYEAADGSVTSWGRIFNGVPISKIGLGGLEETHSGGVPGEACGKGIGMSLTNIDTNFKSLKVGYIYVTNEVTRAFEEKSYTITGSTLSVRITGSSRTELTLDEVLTPNIIFNKTKTLTSLQKSLYAGGVEYDEDPNFQTYANIIDVKWYLASGVTGFNDGTVHINGTARNTFVNGENVFHLKGFKSGEVYALYIAFTLKNGRKTKAFHIPGRAANAGDKDSMNAAGSIYTALQGGSTIYKYQVKNTHTVTNNSIQIGQMCYWENENEEYPLDPSNPSNVHPDFANIPGVTAADRKVRHHQFPDLTMLDDGVNNLGKFTNPDGGFGTGPYVVSSRPFGLAITINLPPEVYNVIDSYEFYYAERSNENIRCLGSDLASDSSGSYVRFNHFDLMRSKPGLTPTHVKPLCRWTTLGPSTNATNFVEYMDTHTIEHNPDASLFSNVEEYAYLGENTTVPYNNTGFADCIIAKINPTVAMNTGITTTGRNVVLFDLCIFRRNMYLGFNNQTLISMGTSYKPTASGVQPTAYTFGGDIHITRHALNPLNSGTQTLEYVCESIANIPFRNEDLALSKYFAPKYTNPSSSWFAYDLTYNAINKFNILDIYYPPTTCIDDDVVEHPNRVLISLVDGSENKAINWRIFKANSYYDMPKDKGAIWSMIGNDRTLYIHHEHSLFLAQIKDSLTTADGAEIAALGVTELFDRPPIEILPTKEGVCGNQSQYGTIICELGYCFVDRQKGEVYILPHGSIVPRKISDQGMSTFFRKYGQTNTINVDNPFIGNGYTMAYDSEYRRLIITKKDSVFSFTISYSPEANQGQGGWISFHDYKPNFILSSRDGLYAIENTLHKFFRHNSNTLKSRFYDGAIKKSHIDVVFNDRPDITKAFDNVHWITNVEDGIINYEKETATHLIVYNASQCSNEIDLSEGKDMWYGRDVKDTEETWNFNNFRDLIKDTTLPFLDTDGALITSNINSAKSWYNKSKFVSKFVVFRVIYDNVNQRNFHLSYVGSNFKKSDR